MRVLQVYFKCFVRCSCCEYILTRSAGLLLIYMFANTWSTKYTSTVCAPCRQFSGPLFGTNHSQIYIYASTSGSWGKLLSLGTTRILETLAVFREYVPRGVCTASTLSISMFSLYFTLSAKKRLFCWNMFIVCSAGFYSAGHKVSCRNLDLAQLLYYLRLSRKH